MTIAITGANSAVGLAILRRLADEASPVDAVLAVRSERAASALAPYTGPRMAVMVIDYEAPATVSAALRGASAVVHLPGILVEHGRSTYEQAHVATTRAVLAAARAAAVRKLVLVSAVGASPTARNRYWRSKGVAEALVRASGVPFTILRAPVLLGCGTEAAWALDRRLDRRTVWLVGRGGTRQQPLDVDDLARAVLAATDPAAARNATLDLVGPTALTEREILERAARALDRPLHIRAAPRPLVALALAIRRGLGLRGFSRDALEVVTTDTAIDPAPAAAALGLALTSVDETIRRSLSPRR